METAVSARRPLALFWRQPPSQATQTHAAAGVLRDALLSAPQESTVTEHAAFLPGTTSLSRAVTTAPSAGQEGGSVRGSAPAARRATTSSLEARRRPSFHLLLPRRAVAVLARALARARAASPATRGESGCSGFLSFRTACSTRGHRPGSTTPGRARTGRSSAACATR